MPEGKTLRVLTLLTAVISAVLVAAVPSGADERRGADDRDAGPNASTALNAECVAVPGVNDRCPSWVATYDNANGHNGTDAASAVALSPSGDRVFVTGGSWDNDTGDQGGCCPTAGGMDTATAAFDPATGERLWAARYNGAKNSKDKPLAIAVSPDGSTVFVTGSANQVVTPKGELTSDMMTLAYDAATGTRRWARVYSAPGAPLPYSGAHAVTVSPDGSRAYVTGFTRTWDPDTSVLSPPTATTIAYDAATGAQLWVSGRPGGGLSIDVSPSGDRVYVTGFVQIPPGGPGQYLTMAYEAQDPDHLGEVLWTATYAAGTSNMGALLDVSPDGSRVFVTGEQSYDNGVTNSLQASRYGTVAYDAGTGDQLWASTHASPVLGSHIPTGLVSSPAGDRVFVTGYRVTPPYSSTEYVTVAYDSATGAPAWANQYLQVGGTYTIPTGVAVSPDGGRVYVTGRSSVVSQDYTRGDIATVAYAAATGVQAWAARFNSAPGQNFDYGSAVAVTPDGTGVLVAGASERRPVAAMGVVVNPSANPGDYVVLRYEA